MNSMKYRRTLKNKPKVSPIFLLPSMFTLGAMFFGFYAIVQSVSLHFIQCGVAIFFAMILDSLDGRVARLTHTSSPFGAQLDSLSDMVSFGVAPAMIAFNWHLHSLGKLGWLIAFIYCACSALRLARFNTMLENMDKRYFIGLPSPSAAILVVGFVYLSHVYKFNGKFALFLGVVITLISAVSMVNNVKFYSFKEYNFGRRGKFQALIIALMILCLFVIYPDLVTYGFFISYLIISYAMWGLRVGYVNKDTTTALPNHTAHLPKR